MTYTFPKSVTMSAIETRINDIFHMAQIYRWTSCELTDHLIERVSGPLAERSPAGRRKHSAWLEGFAAGIIAARRSIIWREQVEFCYKVDGVLYSTWRKTAREKTTQEFYDRNEGHILNNAEGAHYWINSDKVF